MKPNLLLTFLLIPFLVVAQRYDANECGPVGYTQLGATIFCTRPTAAGFHIARHQPVNNSSLYIGLGVEAIRIQEHWQLPMSFHLTLIPSTSSVSPAFTISPGYVLTKSETVKGVSIYAGAGIVLYNGQITVGYQQLGKEAGCGVKLSVML